MAQRYGMQFGRGADSPPQQAPCGHTYRRVAAKCWRWIAPDTGAHIGPQYASRAELLASTHPYEVSE